MRAKVGGFNLKSDARKKYFYWVVTFFSFVRLSHQEQKKPRMETNKQKAFMQAYEDCHGPFIKYCTALAFGKMDTEDLVQDVLLSAYHHFDSIQQKGQLLHYLIRAAKNRSISWWRKSRFRGEWLEKHSEQLQAQGLSPETSLDIELLYRAIDRLNAQQKHAILLFEISGFSIKEIAVIQKCSIGAVKTRLSRARQRLSVLLLETSIVNPFNELLKTAQSISL